MISKEQNDFENVVIDLTMNPDCMEQLEALKHSPILNYAKHIHLIHVYNQSQNEFIPFNITETGDLDIIQKHIEERLMQFKERLTEGVNGREWSIKCLLSADSKIRALDYLRQQKANLVICSTKGQQGIEGCFTDSFSYYLVENAPCDVYVVRPVHKHL